MDKCIFVQSVIAPTRIAVHASRSVPAAPAVSDAYVVSKGQSNVISKMRLNQYGCWSCSTMGCKLWRYWDNDSSELKCACCMPISTIDVIIEQLNRRNDLIDNMYPAVPYPDGNSYYEYGSAPEHLIEWWYLLPI